MEPELRHSLIGLYGHLAQETRERWDRDLPLSELLSDRWDRARTLGFGEGSSIYAESYVYGRVRVGKNVWIGPFTLLDGTGRLDIGDGSTISAGVHVYTHDTVLRTISGGDLPTEHSPVVIGKNVYVGAQSVVGRGTTIGDQAVIGARSFVNQDIPARSVAAGTPARVIGEVVVSDDGTIELRY